MADYGVVLLHELLAEQQRILQVIASQGTDITDSSTDKALISIVNCAPRDSKTTAQGRNGEEFHLAITDNGLEIYAVPLARLQALETRHKILALYRIPNESLIVTDGQHEQFRSSLIATTRYFPDILVPIFEYPDRESLLEAKRAGIHPQVIPEQSRLAEVAFIDRFGNVRLSVKDQDRFRSPFQDSIYGATVKIQVGDSKTIDAYYVRSLSEIPSERLGIYQNVADDHSSHAGYRELVKKSEDCSHDPLPASKILENLDSDYRNKEITVTAP